MIYRFDSANNTGIEHELRRRGKAHSVPLVVNWGHPGDELFEAPLDELDPSYDSAEENFEKAYAAHKKNVQKIEVEVDWADLVNEAHSSNESTPNQAHTPFSASSDLFPDFSENTFEVDSFFLEVCCKLCSDSLFLHTFLLLS